MGACAPQIQLNTVPGAPQPVQPRTLLVRHGKHCIVTTIRRGHIDTVNLARNSGCLRRNAAFSLLELLIVAALIIIMFTFYWGGGSRGFQMKQIANCEKNLEYDFVAIKTYSVDNDGKFPFLAGAATSEPVLSQLVPRATTRTEFFICPGSRDKAIPSAEPFARRTISYAFYMGHTAADGSTEPLMSDRQVDTQPKVTGEYVFSPTGRSPGNNHHKYGGNFLLCDGSVQDSPAQLTFSLPATQGVVLLNPKP